MTTLTAFQLLVSKSKKNPVACAECHRESKGGHLYCVKFEIKDNEIAWRGKYMVGCTHTDWDGEPWCDSCYTIADNKVLCSNCSCLDWGRPEGSFRDRHYIWIDGSESCWQDIKNSLATDKQESSGN